MTRPESWGLEQLRRCCQGPRMTFEIHRWYSTRSDARRGSRQCCRRGRGHGSMPVLAQMAPRGGGEKRGGGHWLEDERRKGKRGLLHCVRVGPCQTTFCLGGSTGLPDADPDFIRISLPTQASGPRQPWPRAWCGVVGAGPRFIMTTSQSTTSSSSLPLVPNPHDPR